MLLLAAILLFRRLLYWSRLNFCRLAGKYIYTYRALLTLLHWPLWIPHICAGLSDAAGIGAQTFGWNEMLPAWDVHVKGHLIVKFICTPECHTLCLDGLSGLQQWRFLTHFELSRKKMKKTNNRCRIKEEDWMQKENLLLINSCMSASIMNLKSCRWNRDAIDTKLEELYVYLFIDDWVFSSWSASL